MILDQFKPRDYQIRLINALEVDGYRKLLCIWPRRAGKDICAWNIAIRQCLMKTCLVMYALPTYSQARKTIFDALVEDKKFLDYIPKQMIESINSSEMKITFRNKSVLRLIGADSYDTSLVGTNVYGLILSEAALMDLENVYTYSRPILAHNNGWVMMISTPRGKNALYRLYETAKGMSDWYVSKLTVEDTKHIPAEVLEVEKNQMSEGMYQQEYMTSFERGQQGLIFGKELDDMKREGRLQSYLYSPARSVFVSFDIGVRDATALVFFQVDKNRSRISVIDYYQNTGYGIEHYALELQNRGYKYEAIYMPPDIEVREWGNGAMTRLDKARDLGMNVVVLSKMGVEDSIENAKTLSKQVMIDKDKCQGLVDCLENYRREYDNKHQVYGVKPVHNFASNGADAYRYMCQAYHMTESGLTGDEFNREKMRALYGSETYLGVSREQGWPY